MDHKFEGDTSADEDDWDFYEAVGGKKVSFNQETDSMLQEKL